ncbi:hypothetical protein LXA43DRAFT_1163490 [Ganoderma leucocontextum]|nr:hypothetical protein LXA43DRAFT_1163490 [Ganoderma leucocontextum]
MAAVVAPSNFTAPPNDPRNASAASSGVGKTRYRPAPAKTFQCRGYGECRMVFSRSEHLARHIRKHTGERPFTCHCSKQFSRLDNLRQHAQTVHADKQDQNERMMQELTSLHANMTAASKGSGSRAKRPGTASNPSAGSPNSNPSLNGSIPSMAVKTEDGSHALLPMSQRPGTSTGYEGANAFLQPSSNPWHIQTSDVDRPIQRPTNSHSFRDPGQSFRAPASASSASPSGSASLIHQQHQHHSGQSFLVPSASTFNFSLPDIPSAPRPGSSSSPSAAAPSASESSRSLPPLSALVASSLPPVRALPPPPGSSPLAPLSAASQHQQQPLTHSSVLPPPTPTGPYFGQRPSTAVRPGTAPASYYYPPRSAGLGAFASGAGALPSLGPPRGSELSLRFAIGAGRLGGGLEPIRRLGSGYGGGGEDAGGADEPTSPGGYDSPFSFHAPATGGSAAASYASESSAAFRYAPGASNPRKRPYSGSDDDDGPRERGERIGGDALGRPVSSSGREYDYGSESRPQSRRLSVMELCNDPPADAAAARPFVPLSGPAGGPSATGALSRPTTSSGLVTSAAQLALVDRASLSPPPAAAGAEPAYGGAGASLFARAAQAAAGTAPAAAPAARGDGGAGAAEFGGGVPEAALRGVWLGGPAFGQPAPHGRGGSVFPSASAGGQLPGWAQSRSPSFSPSPAASPRSFGAASPAAGHASAAAPGSPGDLGRGLSPPGRRGPGSPGVGGAGAGGESRGNDQVRIPAAVGMRA